MRLSSWLLLFAASGLACATVSVRQDFDPDADFSNYSTYAWMQPRDAPTGDPRADNPLIHSRVRAAIDRTLASRGYRPTEDTPDFYVGYHLSLRSRLDVRTIDTAYGYGRAVRWGGIGYETQVTEYDEGTLIVDIADNAKQTLVWRGSGTRRVSRNPTPEKTTETLNRAVEEILAQFPPG
jgi:hypothetical protein